MNKPSGVDNVIEQVIEGFDNALINEDNEVLEWFKENKLVVEFTAKETIIKEVKLKKGVKNEQMVE
jgi:hypothetical protein